jgi:hypothetical protein
MVHLSLKYTKVLVEDAEEDDGDIWSNEEGD